MQVFKNLVFLATMVAGGASADARFSTENAVPTGLFGLTYTQAQIDSISDSDLRRLSFYADRASRALQTLVEGASERSISEQDKVNLRFRESILRLADAGKRSGISMDQVADFYTQSVFDKFGQGFMQQVAVVAGGLDFRTLFRNVATLPDQSSHLSDSGADFLNALAEASEDLDLGVPLESPARVASVAPSAPQPLANANTAEREIVNRIRVIDGRWELTIERGDSLSIIASAIYGDALSYTAIYSANTNVLNSINVIDVGTVLVLPQR